MAVSCGKNMILYILPMILGRTYDMQHNTVGIDIYNDTDIERAKENPFPDTVVTSSYMTIEDSSERRAFLGVSGDFALKISAGHLNIRGMGEYLKDTSNTKNSVEILIKMTFTTMTQEIDPDAEPLEYWKSLDRDSVGTHVITSLVYGGEMYASVNFIARKEEYLRSIKAAVNFAFGGKKGSFDFDAQGNLSNLAKNISSKAKMEINYFATVPLKNVPTTIEGLRSLVNDFKPLVEKINDGHGVPICAGLKSLYAFQDKFKFDLNKDLQLSLDEFNFKFDNLREAKSMLKSFVSSLPITVPDDYLKTVINFSDRLTSTLMEFHEVIGNLDLEKGDEQLKPALQVFDNNSDIFGENRYTTEMMNIKSQLVDKEDPGMPRGIFVRWGKRSCGANANSILYLGFMASFPERGVGAGTEYQCLPENPDLKLDFDISGSTGGQSALAAVRYTSFSIFKQTSRSVENKIASCSVCESYLRPTVRMFSATKSCPIDWVEEYTGFLVTSNRTRARSEFVCLDSDPDSHGPSTEVGPREPVVLPAKMGDKGVNASIYTKDASIPCVVCSK